MRRTLRARHLRDGVAVTARAFGVLLGRIALASGLAVVVRAFDRRLPLWVDAAGILLAAMTIAFVTRLRRRGSKNATERSASR